jgi:hypothetical protein
LVVTEEGDVVKRYSSPASAKGSLSFWSHNGSVLYLIADGSSREFRYYQPRQGMVEAGARPDSLLFEGQSEDGAYSGTAYIFDARCERVPYQVRGPILDDYQRVVLQGRAPQMGSDCRIERRINEKLEFTLIKMGSSGYDFQSSFTTGP